MANTCEPFAKLSFRPDSALCSKFYPPVSERTETPRYQLYACGKFLACLDFERKSYFYKRLG